MGFALYAACSLGHGALAEEVLTVTLNKSTVLKLNQAVNTIVVGKSEIADVSMESRSVMLISGKSIGETDIFVLDRSGNEIARYNVIVAPPDDRQVTVHRSPDALMTYSCSPRCIAIKNPTDVIGTKYVPPAVVNAPPTFAIGPAAPVAPATSSESSGVPGGSSVPVISAPSPAKEPKKSTPLPKSMY